MNCIYNAIQNGIHIHKKQIEEYSISYHDFSTIKNQFPKISCEDNFFNASYLSECLNILKKHLDVDYLKNTYLENDCLIIKNIPIDDLCETPYNGDCDLNFISQSIGFLLGFYELISAKPIAYLGENNNKIIRHVVPNKNTTQQASSHGSLITFDMHVDNPHLPLTNEVINNQTQPCPEHLALLALRCDLNVPTNLVFLDDIIASLPKFILEVLQKPLFCVKWPDSFGHQTNNFLSPVIIKDENEKYLTRFDKQNIIALTDDAKHALDVFYSVSNAASIKHKVFLQSDDLIIFNNQRFVHSRDAFTPKMNGMDRWLLRIFGVSKSTSSKFSIS